MTGSNISESVALAAVDQDSITFYGREIVAVRLADGRIFVPLRWICASLQLDTNGQARRIRRTEAITSDLSTVRVQTEGGLQAMPALDLRAVPFWLAGINTRQVAEELRPVVLAYQREVVDVLYRHFAERKPTPSEPRTLVPSEPITKPVQPERGAPDDAWIAYFEQMAVWLRWRADVDRWRERMEHRQDVLESRMEGVEEVTRLVPEILDRLGPQTLSAEHQRTVQAGINRLHELTSRPHAAIYNDLREAFHVGTYKDIPETRWSEVAAWLQSRIARAGGQPPEQSSLL